MLTNTSLILPASTCSQFSSQTCAAHDTSFMKTTSRTPTAVSFLGAPYPVDAELSVGDGVTQTATIGKYPLMLSCSLPDPPYASRSTACPMTPSSSPRVSSEPSAAVIASDTVIPLDQPLHSTSSLPTPTANGNSSTSMRACAAHVACPGSVSSRSSAVSNLGAPYPADAELGVGDGATQTALLGKYSCSLNRALPDQSPASRPPLNVYYQNVGGINTQVKNYLLATSACSYDIIVLTETWLNDNTISRQIFGADYEVFRCDRNLRNSIKSSGGGVLVAVRRTLKAHALSNDVWESVEQLWVEVELSTYKLYVCAVYIPPDRTRDASLIDCHLRSIDSILELASPIDELMVLGDFNLPHVNWTSSQFGFLFPDLQQSVLQPAATELLDGYSAATLRQINSVRNENDRLLDLCFVSAKDNAPSLTEAPTSLVKKSPHHPPLLISLTAPLISRPTESTAVRYDFSKADYEAITNALLTIRWSDILNYENVDDAAQILSHVLSSLVERHVPKACTSNPDRQPWQTPALCNLKRRKRKALRKYSRNPTPIFRAEYRNLNRQYHKMAKRCFSNYERRTQRRLKSHPKAFWRFVNEQRKESCLPSSMRYLGRCTNNISDTCTLFAEKFAGVFCNERLSTVQIEDAVSHVPLADANLNTIRLTHLDIQQACSKLKFSYSAGPDGFPSALLKNCLSGLLEPLLHVYQLSLSTGVFPEYWKTANMFPVHKKGPRNDINNYRGISSLNAIAKLFELVVIDPIFDFCKGYIADEQHGFMPKRSTTSNLLEFTSYVFDGFNDGLQTDAIYTDLSAAFDKINHDITIAKLSRLGFSGTLLTWLESYLRNRLLKVKISEHESDTFAAHSGIPQGSHLGPLLFLLYFNDVNRILKGPRLAYADDMKLFYRIRTSGDAVFLQQQLELFIDWCKRNRMVINPDKCSVVSFSKKKQTLIHNYRIGDFTINRVNCIKDLGVLLDTELTFTDHISYIVGKASRNLGFIFRVTKSFKDVYCLKALYCCLVRSILEYCIPVWSPFYQNAITRIESIQRRFVRFALRHLPWRNRYQLPRYEHRCRLINIDTLENRRAATRSLFVADVLAARIECPTVSNLLRLHPRVRMLRNNNRLFIPYRRTNYGSNSAIVGLLRAFNRTSEVYDPNISRVVLRQRFLTFLSN